MGLVKDQYGGFVVAKEKSEIDDARNGLVEFRHVDYVRR